MRPNTMGASYCKKGSVVSAILGWGDSMKRRSGEQRGDGMAMTLDGAALYAIDLDLVLGGAGRVRGTVGVTFS